MAPNLDLGTMTPLFPVEKRVPATNNIDSLMVTSPRSARRPTPTMASALSSRRLVREINKIQFLGVIRERIAINAPLIPIPLLPPLSNYSKASSMLLLTFFCLHLKQALAATFLAPSTAILSPMSSMRSALVPTARSSTPSR